MYKVKMLKKLTAVILLVAMVLSITALSSCGKSDDAVLTVENVECTEAMYRYWYIQLKDYYVSNYGIVDSMEFWKSKVTNADYTYAEFVDNKIATQINYYLAGNVLFEQHKLDSKLKSTWQTICDGIDEEIDDGVNSFGSRAEYDAYLDQKYGIDSSIYRRVKQVEQKFYMAYDYLYNSESGIERATATEIDAYYTEKYARIKYYMVLKNFEYRLDSAGNRVTNSDGSYIQDPLTEKEKQEKAVYAAAAFEAVKKGEDIDTFIKKDYPDILSSAPNGYYLAMSEYYGRLFTNTILEATFGMEVGETVLCENDDAYFIVQRLLLPAKGYQGVDKDQLSNISEFAVNAKFEKKFAPIIDVIQKDAKACGKYTVVSLLEEKYK